MAQTEIMLVQMNNKCGRRPTWLTHMNSLLVSGTGRHACGKWKLGQINKDEYKRVASAPETELKTATQRVRRD